ncbi:MAG: PadR family transcriptional regulator [Kineosporiaceae bacterium]|nr:PadR family transcriptional regulator [Kineosporiaceae bacterium]
MDTTQLLKGVLDLAVLAVVSTEDGYGYDVVRRLRAAGLDDVGDASVYGTLRRLYSAGALTSYVVPSDEGPHRKYYGINPHGRSLLTEQSRTWAGFADTMSALLAGAGPEVRLAGATPAGQRTDVLAVSSATSSKEPVR